MPEQSPLPAKTHNPIAQLTPLNAAVAKHQVKDVAMGEVATQFIGTSSAPSHIQSSTRNYTQAWAALGLANTGNYSSSDIIMVSGSGPWRGVTMPMIERTFQQHYVPLLEQAIAARASFVVGNAAGTDTLVRAWLIERGYRLEEHPDGYGILSHPQRDLASNAALAQSETTAMNPVRITIASLYNAEQILSSNSPDKPTHVISIGMPNDPLPARLETFPHLRLEFADTRDANHRLPPQRHHVEQAISFGREAQSAKGHLLIHCEMGISRSSGIALAVLADQMQESSPKDVLQRLDDIKEDILPNALLVRWVDELIRGDLIDYLPYAKDLPLPNPPEKPIMAANDINPPQGQIDRTITPEVVVDETDAIPTFAPTLTRDGEMYVLDLQSSKVRFSLTDNSLTASISKDKPSVIAAVEQYLERQGVNYLKEEQSFATWFIADARLIDLAQTPAPSLSAPLSPSSPSQGELSDAQGDEAVSNEVGLNDIRGFAQVVMKGKEPAGDWVIVQGGRDSVLGNPFLLQNPKSDSQRQRVIAAHNQYYELVKGGADPYETAVGIMMEQNLTIPNTWKAPTRAEYVAEWQCIDDLVAQGKQVAAVCYCGAGRCHLDALAQDWNRDRSRELNPFETQMEVATDCPSYAIAVSEVVAPGINIYSRSREMGGLGAALTNPSSWAKNQGIIDQTYPVTYNDTWYVDAEQAYQRNKVGGRGEGDRELMVSIIAHKLVQHPELITAINECGGVPWLEQCRHQTGARSSSLQWWEGTGRESPFIERLISGYERALVMAKDQALKLPEHQGKRI